MLIHRTYRFRIYPTAEQRARLLRWEGALRFLWNLANEQRLMGLSRTDKRYPTAPQQQAELTTLRASLPWLADVPRNVSAQMLSELDKAWRRYFLRLTGLPNWKSKQQAPAGMTESHHDRWRLRDSSLHFAKLGDIRVVAHRAIEGDTKTCSLKRDGDQWFALITCEIDAPAPTPRDAPVVAIDRGITRMLADSDGNLTDNPKFYQRAMTRLARAQRTVSRRKKGSKNRDKAKLRVMRLHRKVRRQREHFLHVQSARLAKSHGVVVIEKLNVAGMIRGNLSRSIADAGWSRFAEMLRYKLAWSGGTLIEVPAAYSSQTCSVCGAVDAASRKAEAFCCTLCDHVDHADLNAAKVLLTRANRSGLPVDGILPEGTGRSRKAKVKLRTPRSVTLQRTDNV